MSKQPDALGYAVCLDARGFAAEAAELRRLHSLNAELLEALKRVKETRVFIGAIAQGMMDNAIARAAPEVKS